LNSCNATLTKEHFVNEWKNRYGFVTYHGHGDKDGVGRFCWTSDQPLAPPNPSGVNICGNGPEGSIHRETEWYSLFENYNCTELDDTHPSIVVQASCSNGYPESATNPGYSLLKHGAVSTVCATRWAWRVYGAWDPTIGREKGDEPAYGFYCFDQMVTYDRSIGDALNYCRWYFYAAGWNDGSSWMNMLVFNIYGDPSLMLWTECLPQCHYDDWILLGSPACWCSWPYQCDGDADGQTETILKYRVYGNDLTLVRQNWKKKAGDWTLNPCADIDHKAETASKYRVYNNDLATVVANWKKKDSQLPANCPRCVQAAAKGQAAALDVDALVKWLEEVWKDPEVQKVLDEKSWQEFVESLKEYSETISQ
jgi:hypothetical protein